MLFQMVPFILLCMVAHSTITWLVESIPTANQRALFWWLLKLPWREKRKVPSERAIKTERETGVKSDTPFCSQLPIKKTNSACFELLVDGIWTSVELTVMSNDGGSLLYRGAGITWSSRRRCCGQLRRSLSGNWCAAICCSPHRRTRTQSGNLLGRA